MYIDLNFASQLNDPNEFDFLVISNRNWIEMCNVICCIVYQNKGHFNKSIECLKYNKNNVNKHDDLCKFM